ncbi:MAG: hypothetical protein U0X73_02245 [Thermoanaerobaculia bacterium]
MSKRVTIGTLVLLLGIASLWLASPAAANQVLTYTGNILSGAQYDLYNLNGLKGYQKVQATLVCDETVPGNGNRPLDPVLSAYFPGSDSSDTANADVYNDDGFGSDDYPNGVDCNAFDSSIISFVVPFDGDYVLRADGFGSAIGPYTLEVRIIDSPFEVPTLNFAGLAALALALAAASVLLLRRRRA